MGWCRQATSHYKKQYWLRYISSCGSTRQRCVNTLPCLQNQIMNLIWQISSIVSWLLIGVELDKGTLWTPCWLFIWAVVDIDNDQETKLKQILLEKPNGNTDDNYCLFHSQVIWVGPLLHILAAWMRSFCNKQSSAFQWLLFTPSTAHSNLLALAMEAIPSSTSFCISHSSVYRYCIIIHTWSYFVVCCYA